MPYILFYLYFILITLLSFRYSSILALSPFSLSSLLRHSLPPQGDTRHKTKKQTAHTHPTRSLSLSLHPPRRLESIPTWGPAGAGVHGKRVGWPTNDGAPAAPPFGDLEAHALMRDALALPLSLSYFPIQSVFPAPCLYFLGCTAYGMVGSSRKERPEERRERRMKQENISYPRVPPSPPYHFFSWTHASPLYRHFYFSPTPLTQWTPVLPLNLRHLIPCCNSQVSPTSSTR
ncbi:hypothetical protein LX32DRAFT_465535 [Colletotrichum zoysiae]|uniref:Uncharacterized protein n=1 Tax=Colletotrichum zoysiae TaxID=1216348 RepID=A0AAD9LZN2_9PEZI|nr:hypothetical protein LX32DRAFT_465535 [Colletotrichum zoysiae]